MGNEHDREPTGHSSDRRMTAAEALAMHGTGWDGDLPSLRAMWARPVHDDAAPQDLGTVIGSDADAAAIDLDIDRRKDLPRETDL